jgi:rhomboid family GlyGly-CTERM serine protease
VWERIKHSSDWRFVAVVIPVMALLQVIGPEYFRYERDWVTSGEIWRVISAHWIHVGWMHWLFNSLGLIIMVSLTAPGWSIRRWVIQTLCMAIGISILFTLFNPDLVNYAGYSGVLYGLYILGALRLFTHDRLIASLVIVAIVGKVIMEQFNFYDFNTGDIIGARVIVDAHLYGLLIAIAIALIWATYTMNHDQSDNSS